MAALKNARFTTSQCLIRAMRAMLATLSALVSLTLLPDLSNDEFYWHQLEGLEVTSHFEGQQIRLGVVKSLLETGANDVLVVEGDAHSVDRQERLIPYAEQYVTKIDVDSGIIDVIWDPEF